MFKLSNTAVVLLEELLRRHQAQVFGSWFQDSVATALGTIDPYRGCYINRGAGQPDIIATGIGFEVKTSSEGTVDLQGNYRQVRDQYPLFKLVGLRTDVKPWPLWVIDMPLPPPPRLAFRRDMPAETPTDAVLGPMLAARLSQVVVAAGTSWTDARDRAAGVEALKRAAEVVGT